MALNKSERDISLFVSNDAQENYNRIFSFFKKVFYIGVKLMNSVVLILGVQQSDSVIHIYMHPFKNSFPIWVITEY